MVAMELQTMLLLKRRRVPLKRDVIFMAAADEECGGRMGAGWVLDNRPDLLADAEYALNEGGGSGRELNGRLYYTVQTAEKGIQRFRLRMRGEPGHASLPHDDNAVVKLAEKLSRLRHARLPIHMTATARAHIQGLAADQPEPVRSQVLAILETDHADAAIDAIDADEVFRRNLRAILRNTVSPTILQAGKQINVIPSEAEAQLDGRILPGQTRQSFLRELCELFGEDVEIDFITPEQSFGPLETEPQGPLWDTILQVMAERAPGSRVIPRMLAGATDAKHVTRLGTRVFGFAPELYLRPGESIRIHGHDERIATESLRWGMRTLYEVVERFCC